MVARVPGREKRETLRLERQLEHVEAIGEAIGQAAWKRRDEVGRGQNHRRENELVHGERHLPPVADPLQLLVDEAVEAAAAGRDKEMLDRKSVV